LSALANDLLLACYGPRLIANCPIMDRNWWRRLHKAPSCSPARDAGRVDVVTGYGRCLAAHIWRPLSGYRLISATGAPPRVGPAWEHAFKRWSFAALSAISCP